MSSLFHITIFYFKYGIENISCFFTILEKYRVYCSLDILCYEDELNLSF